MTTPRTTVCYAHKIPMGRSPGFRYAHIYPNNAYATYLSDDTLPLFKVQVTELLEATDGCYWSWWDNTKSTFHFTAPARDLVSMCFPYGEKAEEDRGNGVLLPVVIEELCTFSGAKAKMKDWAP